MGLKLWPGRLHSYDRQVAAGNRDSRLPDVLDRLCNSKPVLFSDDVVSDHSAEFVADDRDVWLGAGRLPAGHGCPDSAPRARFYTHPVSHHQACPEPFGFAQGKLRRRGGRYHPVARAGCLNSASSIRSADQRPIRSDNHRCLARSVGRVAGGVRPRLVRATSAE